VDIGEASEHSRGFALRIEACCLLTHLNDVHACAEHGIEESR